MTIERSENSHTWHPDVQFYSLKKEGKQKAYFYLDPYSRPAGGHKGCCSSLCAVRGPSVCMSACSATDLRRLPHLVDVVDIMAFYVSRPVVFKGHNLASLEVGSVITHSQ